MALAMTRHNWGIRRGSQRIRKLRRSRSGQRNPMPSTCTTCTAMSGNWSRIAFTTTIGKPRRTGLRGAGNVVTVCFAAARGSPIDRVSARPCASGPTPTADTPSSASVLRGPSPPESSSRNGAITIVPPADWPHCAPYGHGWEQIYTLRCPRRRSDNRIVRRFAARALAGERRLVVSAAGEAMLVVPLGRGKNEVAHRVDQCHRRERRGAGRADCALTRGTHS